MSGGIEEVDSNLIETNYDHVVYSFDDLNLKPNILRGKFSQFKFLNIKNVTLFIDRNAI